MGQKWPKLAHFWQNDPILQWPKNRFKRQKFILLQYLGPQLPHISLSPPNSSYNLQTSSKKWYAFLWVGGWGWGWGGGGGPFTCFRFPHPQPPQIFCFQTIFLEPLSGIVQLRIPYYIVKLHYLVLLSSTVNNTFSMPILLNE
jgi:hypothetical protein